MSERPLPQKTIGVLGGSSDVATAAYYRELNAAANARLGGWDIAETVIVGMNFGDIEAWLRADDWPALERHIAGKVDRLEAAGADLIIGVSNTLHRALESIMARRATSFLHIVDPAAEAIAAAGLRRVALFGTGPVMREDYIRRRYEERHGLEIVTPSATEQDDIHQIIFDELVRNDVRRPSKERYLAIADRLVREEGVQGLILGCTEIFLLLEQSDRPALPMFDTTRLHCRAAVEAALA